MNFLKRGWASITRRKGKSFILFAVVFVLGNVIAGAISIQEATKSVEKNIKNQLGGVATVSMDYKKVEKFYSENSSAFEDDKIWQKELAPPTVTELKKIAKLSYVKNFDYSSTGWIETDQLKNDASSDGSGVATEGTGNYNFNLKGVNDPTIFDIKQNKIELVGGRVFTKEEVKKGSRVVVISKKVANENNLNIGDKMTVDAVVSNDNGNMDGNEKIDKAAKNIILEVIGIFEPVKAEKSKNENKNAGMSEFLSSEQINTFYLVNKSVENINQEISAFRAEKFPAENGVTSEEYSSYYELKSPEDVEAFRKEAAPYIKSKYYTIVATTDQYDSIAGPIKGMGKISNYVIVIAVIATLFIISLVVLLFLRDRKHELGIYLSLGEKRSKVIGQIVLEVLLISFVAISLSVFSGNFLAKGVSESLIQSQMSNQTEDFNSFDYTLSQISSVDLNSEDVTQSYEISLSPRYIGLFYLIGLVTLLLSTILPLIYILRLNPKKIMM